MPEYSCRVCGEKERFKIQLYGKIIVETTIKRGKQTANRIDLSEADVVECVCVSCGARRSKGEITEK